MASKNGSKELISLLQYMKESKEWEAVEMNILEVGISNGEMKKLVGVSENT